MFNHPAAPSQYNRGDKAYRWYPAAGQQVRAPLGVHRLRNSLPLILPVSCLSASLHSNLTDSVPGSVSTSYSFSLPNLISVSTCLSVCSSLYVPLYVYFSVSFYLSQFLSFSCSFISPPLALHREKAAVCLCVCLFLCVCVCLFPPSLFLSYLFMHTQTTNGITVFSSLLTPINCYMSPTLAQWKTMFPCREMSFITKTKSQYKHRAGSSLSSASRISHEDPNL